MSTKIQLKRSEVIGKLFSKVDKLNSIQGFANRVLYQEYRRAQIERWETENASQGTRWSRLRPTYRKRKLRIYAGYPYGGQRIGVATGALIKSVVGPSPKHRKIPTGKGFKVYSEVSYAEEFDQKRTITEFSPKLREHMLEMIREYLS